jgi:hypothetical protein
MLNRGNHEDSVMNHRYGFTREVHQKYSHNADRLLKLIDQVYRHLPLGTLINNKIFVVHGGISENTDLNLIASVRRSKVKLGELFLTCNRHYIHPFFISPIVCIDSPSTHTAC